MRTKPSEHTEPDRDRALCYVLSVSLPDIHIRSHLISSHLPPPFAVPRDEIVVDAVEVPLAFDDAVDVLTHVLETNLHQLLHLEKVR